ncbi:hypothetical protein DEJ00_01435 [Curtobacterium sp. MCLR17_039]|uniref:helix-turn-helix domain-containing protein n=1 Tax=Curtobacterium sp. MCLR17_039 TaxID=2175624 RepID=UPI000DAABE6B|nr:helix-turn-helix transcriptional regulator [Curtobacterium sp. MCLR17_039]PZE93909.1 hypothetical protein DEJ00_01435 [Curtobacterium sp. MCLR17_039]
MSQKDLAVAMRERGHRWSQATVWNVERGERPLRLSEANSLAEILEVLSIHTFTVTDVQERVFGIMKQLAAAQAYMEDQVEEVLRLQRRLAAEADALVRQDETALDAGELGKSVRYDVGVIPVELVHDAQTQLLLELRNQDDRGPYTQAMLDGLEQIKWTVDE